MPENENQEPKRARPRSRRGKSGAKTPIVRVDISVAPSGVRAAVANRRAVKLEDAAAAVTPDPGAAEELRSLRAECRQLQADARRAREQLARAEQELARCQAELAGAQPSDLELRRLQRRQERLASEEESLSQERAELAEREAALEAREARQMVESELREETLEARASALDELERRLERKQDELAAYVGQLQGQLRTRDLRVAG